MKLKDSVKFFIIFIFSIWIFEGAKEFFLHGGDIARIAIPSDIDREFFIKVLFTAILGLSGLGILKLYSQSQEKHIGSQIKNELIRGTEASMILLSSMPIKIKLKNFSEKVKETFNLDEIYIFMQAGDSIKLAETQPQFKFLKQKLFSQNTVFENTDINNAIFKSFTQKDQSFSQIISTKEGEKEIICFNIFAPESQKRLSIVIFVKNSHPSMEEDDRIVAKTILYNLSFALYFEDKKTKMLEDYANKKFEFEEVNPTTGIFLPSKINSIIDHEIKRFRRYHTHLSVIVLEIDLLENLKSIFSQNDIDEFLKDFTKTINTTKRYTDYFGHRGENGFIIITPDVDFRGAKQFAEKLRDLIISKRFAKVGKITCSFGLTSVAAKDELEDFVERADKSLKEAIRLGGNKVEVRLFF